MHKSCRDPDAEKTVGRNLFCKGLSELLIAAAASSEKLGFLPSQALHSHTEILQVSPPPFLHLQSSATILWLQMCNGARQPLCHTSHPVTNLHLILSH